MRARARNQLRALWLAREKTLGDFARERREGRGSRVSPCSPESASAPGPALTRAPPPPRAVRGAVSQVIAVGPGAKDKDGKLMAMSVSIGETVLLPEYGASMIKLGDEEFHLIKDMDILGKLEG